MADALDSKSGVSDGVRVRVPPPVPNSLGLLLFMKILQWPFLFLINTYILMVFSLENDSFQWLT